MKKRLNKKGFTMMEMLIVVAIIAVLVAVGIPAFNNALNKAKAGVDMANARTYYAQAMIAAMGNNGEMTEEYDEESEVIYEDEDALPSKWPGGTTLECSETIVTISGTTIEDFTVEVTTGGLLADETFKSKE